MVRVADHFCLLGACGAPVPVPLRHRRPVYHSSATSACVTPQFPRHGRRRAIQLARDLSNTHLLGSPERDLLTLGERQVPARIRLENRLRDHPATFAEPPSTEDLRHAGREPGIGTCRPL